MGACVGSLFLGLVCIVVCVIVLPAMEALCLRSGATSAGLFAYSGTVLEFALPQLQLANERIALPLDAARAGRLKEACTVQGNMYMITPESAMLTGRFVSLTLRKLKNLACSRLGVRCTSLLAKHRF